MESTKPNNHGGKMVGDCGERCARNGDPAYNVPDDDDLVLAQHEALAEIAKIIALYDNNQLTEVGAIAEINERIKDWR